MKNRFSPRAIWMTLVLLSTLNPQLSTFAQGSLTPPGAPAPTMKTLDQVEARTPISSAPFTISTPGSYYLTTNLTVTTGTAITNNADNVTLDLNGFTISSTAGSSSGSGVLINGFRRNVTIKNGHIRGTTTFAAGTFTFGGFSSGITGNIATNSSLRVSDISIHGVGAGGAGIDLSSTAASTLVVERCTVSVVGGDGIRAGLVRDCSVDTARLDGIRADIAINCSGESVITSQPNSGVAGASIVENCQGSAVVGAGVEGGQVNNSIGISTSGIGLNATGALNCQGTSTSGTFGLRAIGTASFCRGRRDGGVALSAGIAIGCTVNGTGTVTSANKFLGTP